MHIYTHFKKSKTQAYKHFYTVPNGRIKATIHQTEKQISIGGMYYNKHFWTKWNRTMS
jgi:hypothetical protein